MSIVTMLIIGIGVAACLTNVIIAVSLWGKIAEIETRKALADAMIHDLYIVFGISQEKGEL